MVSGVTVVIIRLLKYACQLTVLHTHCTSIVNVIRCAHSILMKLNVLCSYWYDLCQVQVMQTQANTCVSPH